MSPADQARLDAWLKADIRHAGAFARAQATLIAYEDLRETSATPARARPAQIDRRRLLQGGGLAAGVAAAGLGAGLFIAPESAHATGRGEIRTLDLGRGTRITLDALTSVTVRRPLGRPVEVGLEEGAIALDCTAAIVSCAGVRLHAADALAVITNGPAGASVVVSRGRLTARGPGGEIAIGPSERARLHAGRADAPERIAEPELARANAWRTGMIALEGVTLEEAVAAFARYSSTTIQLADPATRRRRVTGLFDARDPIGFARSVTVTSDLELTEIAQGVRLSAPLR